MSDAATKDDVVALKSELKNDIGELKQWILEREVSTIRWSVGLLFGTQLTYTAIVIGAVYFMLQHFTRLP
jgi:hypothetical protein